MLTLGIDTSNYTTSCAVYNSETNEIIQQKKLLPVKKGEKGIRQSDAVFHHTAQLPKLLEKLFSENYDIEAIGASLRPRDVEGSYMPCFTVGYNTALSLSAVTKKPLFSFSHQVGHILAALYSADKLEFVNEKFIAFHISGGTTEALVVTPGNEYLLNTEIICATSDLNCGQLVDRCGVMLSLDFPCGKGLEELALNSTKTFNPKISIKDGNPSLSGAENLCEKMFKENEEPKDIAKFCLDFIGKNLERMTEFALEKYGNLPLVYSGGVMSNTIIKERLSQKFDARFAAPEFSCDNAAGVAIGAYLKGRG